MKKLPIGIQSFRRMREDDFVYIDKTPLIEQMTNGAGRYFLSRPRRFGKSLLVDTLRCLFEGHRKLFKGLYLEDRWDWSQSFPVIKLDFAKGVVHSVEAFEQRADNLLRVNAENLALQDRPEQDLATRFSDLIHQAYKKYGQSVVVLVDEYDKPILDNIDTPEVAAQVREGLKNLYSVLKAEDEYLQFVLMTGVTKFSKVSLFSGMNQLHDLTLNPRYSTLCGYTQSDLESHFAEHLKGVDWEQLKAWYNGYQFLGEAVYNPFDILLFIDNQQSYRNYWFETGSPSFLLKLFQQRQYFLPDLEAIEVGEEILDSFDVEQINPVTLLFQAGYLTLEKTTERRQRLRFHLKLPNQEVKISLAEQLINAYLPRPAEDKFDLQDRLENALCAGDVAQLEKALQALFAGIPWRNFMHNDLAESEGYYASVLYAFFTSLNAEIIPEDISSHGQADLTVKLGGFIYVMEIKRDTQEDYQQQTPNPALQQIQEKGYSQKYRASGKQVIELGLIFNTQARNLVQLDSQKIL